MREAILEACRSGRLEDLRHAIELNELRPLIGDGAGGDAIAILKGMSADGEGRDILAAIERILASSWAAIPLGADIENNRIYVWPGIAATGTASLDAAARAELARIAPPETLAEIEASGVYSYWRLAIAADGTWHSFSR